ncbi:helix-turn-helix domain-containing protein [Bacillus paranthracis]|uniref:helix-turn-helix transcriptional regulator n=1 Tax=Bacillus cereus group TaxID=86661 RepID=UPI000BFB8A9D|nr:MULTISPECIES: helix-turn-helix domain-containing protein [Bacillus cereus group]MBJ7945695.1 helix-turn-helix domain-containing protein [Bacillus cereus group sp. N24]MCU5387136.1 helix-turn-helix domain-containing protein [Bacillus paranthracis]PGJ00015.1 DNA-binding protein [Bacillus thuringiensis]
MTNFDEISIIVKRKFIKEEVLTTPEAIEFLGVSRARMSHMIKKGKITPVKKLGCVSLFLKDDVIAKRKELELLRVKYRPYEN